MPSCERAGGVWRKIEKLAEHSSLLFTMDQQTHLRIVMNYIYQQMHIQYVKYYMLFVHKLSCTFWRVFAIFSEMTRT